ncbi:MAG: OmpW family protein [Alphaproteobacteria bacterium]|nr:OmpW family protein [Alphaproteobacteria bacterium]
MRSRTLAWAASALVIVACTTGVAVAEDFKTKQAGGIVIRARGIGILPDESGTVLSRSTGADTGLRIGKITNEFQPELDFSYFITKNIAVELIAASASHRVWTANGINVGDVRHLPPTLTLQFHPLPESRFSPYVGAGLNYTWFFNERSGPAAAVQDLKVKNTFGLALQAGLDIAITGGWHVNLDVKKLWLRPDVTTTSLKVNDLHIDPWIVGAGVGYRF